MQKILFTSVFKPFGVDNLYSRVDSKIEIFHNQITKYQGCFSPRIHFNTFGLHAIANNIDTPSVVLDFPTRARLRRELKKGYDYVGIGSIMCNFQKVRAMVDDIHELSPKSKIIIGGFCATIPHLKEQIDVDYVCVGEGISFVRQLLGQPAEFDFLHPDVFSETRRVLGVPLIRPDRHPCIIVGLGCSYGCDFCAPSHHFGRKHLRLLKTGRDVFSEMERLGKKFNSATFTFMGDDNFLLDKKRARELHELVVKSGRQFQLYVFASADLISQWDPAQLAEMGISYLWIGREGKLGDYGKNEGIDMKELVAGLSRHGIRTVLSSILLLDNHTKENVWEDIDDHLSCKPAFSQFAFYSPMPGTPLWDRMETEKRLIEGIPYEEMHAFKQPWFIHPHFTPGEAEELQSDAYLKDFHKLGPGIVRFIDVSFEGYMNMKNSGKETLRKRAEFLMVDISNYRAILQAAEWLVPKPEMRAPIRQLRKRIEAEMGETTLFEKTMAMGLFTFGTKENLVHKYLGDAIQPRTIYTRYRH